MIAESVCVFAENAADRLERVLRVGVLSRAESLRALGHEQLRLDPKEPMRCSAQ